MQRPERAPTGLRGDAVSGFWRATVCGGVLVLAFSVATALLPTSRQPAGQPRLTIAGVAEDPCQQQRALPVPAGLSGQFDPDSSILRTAGATYAAPGLSSPSAVDQSDCAAVAEQADRDWLRAGTVPGDTAAWRSMATRALLDLRLDVRPNGAVVAGWRSGWDYVWPRDSSWVAVALARTGHPAMAYQILRFLQRMQPGNGIWAARYLPDGSGAVLDGRPAQLDADGWVPWAVWSWAVTQPPAPDGRPRRELAQLWPMVVRAADAAARSLASDGLPGPAMDYWENSVQVTLGTAAPLLAGLRAAAALAAGIGGAAAARDGHRWAAAAARLASAITATFGRTGYQRLPRAGSGADAAVTFLGPPFAEPGPRVLRAARSAQQALTVSNGGLGPGEAWTGTPDVAWTAETAFFALFDASTGQHDQAAALLDWLAAHRTNLGSLPEQVNFAGQPASTAPLSWTDAVTLLALLAQTGPVPTVPIPHKGLWLAPVVRDRATTCRPCRARRMDDRSQHQPQRGRRRQCDPSRHQSTGRTLGLQRSQDLSVQAKGQQRHGRITRRQTADRQVVFDPGGGIREDSRRDARSIRDRRMQRWPTRPSSRWGPRRVAWTDRAAR